MLSLLKHQQNFFKLGIPTFNFTLSFKNNKKHFSNLPPNHQSISCLTCKNYWFDSNAYGVCLGDRSNIFVLDIDNKPSTPEITNGLEFWNKLSSKHSKIDTFTVSSISGGKHLYFKLNDKTRIFKNITTLTIDGVKTSIDIKTNGGFIVGAGTFIVDKCYKIENNTSINEMPDWLFKLLVPKEKPKPKTKKKDTTSFNIPEYQEIKDVLDHLEPFRSDDYSQWVNMSFILHDFGDEYFDLFCYFSEKSNKFDLDACLDIWESYDSEKENKLTKASLFYYLKQDDPVYYKKFLEKDSKKSLSLITPFCDLSDQSLNKNVNDPRYLEIDIANLVELPILEIPASNVVLLHSFLGTAKTTCIKQVTDYYKSKDASILVLSPRKFFAKSISTTLKIPCYLDLNVHEMYNSHNLVISMESLWKIENRVYDLIIIDESESCLNQLHSSTMESSGKINAITSLKVFENLIKKSERVICADAFMSRRTVNLFKNLSMDYTIIENKYKPASKKAIEIPMLKKGRKYSLMPLYKKLLTLLKKGKKVIFYVGSKKKLKECEMFLQEHLPDLKCKYYCGDDDDASSKKDFENVNECWSKYQFIATTTVITVGISFTEKHFNHVFIYGIAGGPLIRDIFQAHYRARDIDGNIYFSINPFHINKRMSSEIDIMNRFQNIKIYREMLAYDLKVEISEEKKWLIENYIYSTLEASLGAQHYRALFFKYLEFCNYSFVTKDVAPENFEIEIKEWNKDSFDEIKTIDSEEAKLITIKINKCEATEQEKLIMVKYTFLKHFSPFIKLNLEYQNTIRNLFNEIYVKGNKKMLIWLKNIQKEKRKHVELAYLRQDLMENISVDNDLLKLDYIVKLCKKLEIENTFQEKEINIDSIDGVQLQKDMNTMFGIKNQSKNDGSSHKQIIFNLKSILKDWSGSTLERHKNQKMVNKVRRDVSTFYLICHSLLKDIVLYIK